MAKSSRVSSFSNPEYHQGFITSLASAFMEWFLMFLLFGNAVLSYVITKFARYCNLPLPCLLCSRLDNQKLDDYRDLFCSSHKSDISSLVLCHAHSKLVYVHRMCETCLFSFATINKSNSETYRLLVGKLGDGAFEQDSLVKGKKHNKARRCCCCNELWRPKGYPQSFLRTFSIDLEASHDNGRDALQHKHESGKPVEANDNSSMYHVGYTELKVNSDNESEVQIPKYESNTALYEVNGHKSKEPKQMITSHTDDIASEKLIHPCVETEPSILAAQPQPDNFTTASSMAPASNAPMHGLEELNWHHEDPKARSGSPAELISFDDLPSTDVSESTVKDTKETVDDRAANSEVMQISLADDTGPPKEVSEAVCDSQPGLQKDPYIQSSKSLNLGNAYNMATGSTGKQTSGSFKERNINNSSKISEDLKHLLSQISRGTDMSSFDMSPRVSRNLEELKLSDSSLSGMKMPQKRKSLERNESGLESLDGSVSEVEGETLIDRLKRQIEHDKKLLLSLYKELEEERNASAIAANQAMAMITRLQEEKAALHMDASQYLRMMEEQAEYDMEALQNANDLLAEREFEIQGLEAELEHYRLKYSDEAALLARAEPSYELLEKSKARPFEDRSYSRNSSIPKIVDGLRCSFRDQMRRSFLERESQRTFVSDLSNKLKELTENEVTDPTDREETELHIDQEELKCNADGEDLKESDVSNRKEGSKCKGIVHAAEIGESHVVSSEKQVSSLDVSHEAIPADCSTPENQHKGWHIVEETDLEEDIGKETKC